MWGKWIKQNNDSFISKVSILSLINDVKEGFQDNCRIFRNDSCFFFAQRKYFPIIFLIFNVFLYKFFSYFPLSFNRYIVWLFLHKLELHGQSVMKNKSINFIVIFPSLVLVLHLSKFDLRMLQIFPHFFFIINIQFWCFWSLDD